MEEFRWRKNSEPGEKPGENEPQEPGENQKKYKMTNSGYMYLKVTADRYELPLAVADSATELADMIGTTQNAISSAMCYARKRGGRCQYVRVPRVEIKE